MDGHHGREGGCASVREDRQWRSVVHDGRHETLLAVSIVPRVVDFIVSQRGMGWREAIDSFYRSRTFDLLSDETTKTWYFSALTLYNMWSSEVDTGEIEFPEAY